MPPGLCSINSFNPDLDDWYSCHTSDDEAYQDALERNSIASFFSARGRFSTATSVVYTSIAISSPGRLADADQALAEMVPEPIGDLDPRQQHEPPEIEEEDAPVLKRTRSAVPLQLAFSPSRITSTPSTKTKANAKFGARRGQISRALAGAYPALPLAKVPQPPMPVAGSVRVSVSMQPDSASVRVQILPAIFCFGDVPLPLPTGNMDCCAALLGPEGSVAAEDGRVVKPERYSPQPLFSGPDEPTTPTAEPVATAQLDADCAVKLLTRPRGATPCKPDTPKDQNKKRQGDGKERKSGGSGGFPGIFLQRLFSGMRNSRVGNSTNGCNTEDPPPPATVQELGSELLMASVVIAAADVAATAQEIPVVAGYVQAAAPVATAPSVPATGSSASAVSVNTGREPDMMDEAAVAAHHLSVEIFRNVLQAAADNAGGDSTPKALLSPRDTAFPSSEARMSQRDQVPSTWAAEVPKDLSPDAVPLGGRDHGGTPTRHQEHEPSMSPKQASPPRDAALELLVNLASGVTDTDGTAPIVPSLDAVADFNKHKAAPDAASEDAVTQVKRYTTAGAIADNDGQVTPSLSTDGLALDCSGLPMPELCESPVTVGTPAVGKAVGDSTDVVSNVDEQEGGLHEATAAVDSSTATPKRPLIAAEASPSNASPRTVSKRAYGTVARLVKKIAPNFRDTTVMSMSTSSIQASALAAPAAVAVSVEEVVVDQSQELQSAGGLLVASWEAVPLGSGNVLAKATELAAAAEQPNHGDPSLCTTLTVVDQDGSVVEAAADGTSESSPGLQADAAAELLGTAAPSLFVFGQEHPKGAKLGPGRARSFTNKAATTALSACDDAALHAEAAGRKRKAVDEILPDAKVPVFAERSSQDDLELAPHPEQPTVAATVSPTPVAEVVEQVAAATKGVGVQEPHSAASPTDAHVRVPDTDKKLPVVAAVSVSRGAVATPAASSIETEVPLAVAAISKGCKEPVLTEDVTATGAELSVALGSGARPAVPVIVNVVSDIGGLSTASGTHAASSQMELARDGPAHMNPEPAASVTAAQDDVRHSSGATEKHEGAICTPAKALAKGPAGANDAVTIGGNSTVAERHLDLEPAAAAPKKVALVVDTSVAETQARVAVAAPRGAIHEPDVFPEAQSRAVNPTEELVRGSVLAELQAGTKQQVIAQEAAPDTKKPHEELQKAPPGVATANTEITASPMEVMKPAANVLAAGDPSTARTGEPTERPVEVRSPKVDIPAEGGKHKRRNSGFSFFNCFRG
ncbi:hypothetical protein Vretimale_6133 [Volvox reticuliferus]|uniref:Uncharacterized protein n=1 Tax=Volvox reticuliferus TaxID=1737510 RepID=A0A8J4C9Y7_9CHLO|nr:hypothetical protein Vretifemale_7957 [Volvox reticuliferus]GIM01323.1 hypothetical protein Vretimale_6133 [Volvox reticuliferus]